jgi:transposase-like protein
MKRRIFTPEVFAQIARDVSAGAKMADIARNLGCTLGTLRTKCSIAGVSLRRPGPRGPLGPRKPKPAPSAMALELSDATVRALAAQAAATGTTGDKLAGRLLETIVAENLVTAVLDDA